MKVPAIVDQQCIDIDLKTGVNERERVESVDWTKSLTTVENLCLDELGALVHRPGMLSFSKNYDTGTYAFSGFLRRLLPTPDGLAMLNNNTLYALNEGASSSAATGIPAGAPAWSNRGRACDYGINPIEVGSVRNGDRVSSVTEDSQYIFVAYCTNTTLGAYVSVVDKRSGLIVVTYSFENVGIAMCVTSAGGLSYLHVYEQRALGNHRLWEIPIASLPSSLGSVTPVTLTATANLDYVVQCLPTSDGSVVLQSNTSGPDTYLERFTAGSGGTSVATVTIAGWQASGFADVSNLSQFWVVGVDPGGPSYEVKKLSKTTLVVASTVTDSTASDVWDYPRIASDADGNCRIVSFGPWTTVTGSDIPAADIFSLAAAGTTFAYVGRIPAAVEAAHPFYDSTKSRYMLPIINQRSTFDGSSMVNEELGAIVVCDITSSTLSFASNICNFRPVAYLDDYTALATHPDQANGYQVKALQAGGQTLCIASKSGANSVRYTAIQLLTNPVYHSIAGNNISGGLLHTFDSYEPSETGFVWGPSIFVDETGTAGGPAAGSYNYVCVYSSTDSLGQTHYSRTSAIAGITSTGNRISVQCTFPAVTNHTGYITSGGPAAGRVSVDIYRTTDGGTSYRYLGTASTTTSSVFCATFTDTIGDTLLETRAPLFRQPGIPNSALDRYPSPGTPHVCRHRDRIFTCRGSRVFYSSFAVDGEAPWFNPQFSFIVPGGTGHITALASMDGTLVIYKQDGIWVVDGEGPPENGGTGTEFSSPRKIMTEMGCIDPRSVISTPAGILYQSTRGIEMLTRGLQVIWLGERVSRLTTSYPYITGATFDKNKSRALFVASASMTEGAGGTSTVVLCWDMSADAWSVIKPYAQSSLLQDVAYANVSGTWSVFYTPASGGSCYPMNESAGTYTDGLSTSTTFAPWVIETGWIKAPSKQDRIRVSELMLLTSKQTNHNVKVSYAKDYVDSYTEIATVTPAVINAITGIEQLIFQPPQEAVQAVRFKIEGTVPANTATYPISTGRTCDILAITVRMGVRGGGARVSSAQKS